LGSFIYGLLPVTITVVFNYIKPINFHWPLKLHFRNVYEYNYTMFFITITYELTESTKKFINDIARTRWVIYKFNVAVGHAI